MKKFHIYAAVVCFILAVIIFIFAAGMRRFYSGGFFTLLGIVNIAFSMRKK